MYARKGLRSGLKISGAIIILILIVAVYIGLSSYDGYCISWEPPRRPCTLGEYFPAYIFLMIMFWIFGRPIWTILVFILLLAPPLTGYILGRKAKSNQKEYSNELR
jgi:ABC-type dipeptide/oligopeptide/nickel transport system permease subunit